MDFRNEAQRLAPQLLALREEFHRHPELSRQEFQTAARIERELDDIGITEHRRVGETGVYAVFHGTQAGNRSIVLRADTDALAMQDEKSDVPYRSEFPGRMHACGHDAHTAGLLGAARLLYAHRSAFGGEIRLFFQQAEEIGYGGRLFVREGLLSGVERVFGVHTAPDLPVGTVGIKPGANNASVDHFTVRICGKAAHVSTPHLGADALYVAAQLVVALQALVTRRTSPAEPLLIGVGTLQAGSAYNIVAESAELEGTVRTFSPETRARIRRELDALCRETAALYGAAAETVWEDFAAPLINDPTVCREATQCISSLFGAQAVRSDRALSLGGDDFAEFLLSVPGCYAYVGSAEASRPDTCQPHHSSRFDVAPQTLPVIAALYAAYAFQWLSGGLS